MAKRLTIQKSKSSFPGLAKLHERPAAAPVADKETKRGGKSSNPDFVKLTSYIRKETHLRAKKHLLDEVRDMSDLIEELLGHWLMDIEKAVEKKKLT